MTSGFVVYLILTLLALNVGFTSSQPTALINTSSITWLQPSALINTSIIISPRLTWQGNSKSFSTTANFHHESSWKISETSNNEIDYDDQYLFILDADSHILHSIIHQTSIDSESISLLVSLGVSDIYFSDIPSLVQKFYTNPFNTFNIYQLQMFLWACIDIYINFAFGRDIVNWKSWLLVFNIALDRHLRLRFYLSYRRALRMGYRYQNRFNRVMTAFFHGSPISFFPTKCY